MPEIERRYDATIAGSKFYPDALGIINNLAPDTELDLQHEVANPYDDNACAVSTKDGTQLGHIPRGMAKFIAPIIDAGNLLRVVSRGNALITIFYTKEKPSNDGQHVE